MATYSALPADLSLAFVLGDEFNMSVDLSLNGTGYTWTAIVYEVATVFLNGSPVSGQGATAATFAIETVSAANGQMILSLTETQTAALLPSKSYRWFFRGVSPGGVTRTYLCGTVTPTTP
jgi:hypothetical protein